MRPSKQHLGYSVPPRLSSDNWASWTLSPLDSSTGAVGPPNRRYGKSAGGFALQPL